MVKVRYKTMVLSRAIEYMRLHLRDGYDVSATKSGLEYIVEIIGLDGTVADTPQTERKSCKLELFDDDGNYIEPQTETEIAKGIVHKMIDDAVIAEDAYPDLRQKMHDAVDEYEPQTERFDSTHDPHKEWTDCPWK